MKFINWLKIFLTKNTILLKSIRTLLEALAAWAITALANWLTGYAIPVEVQAAMVAVGAALLAALIAELGKLLPEGMEEKNE